MVSHIAIDRLHDALGDWTRHEGPLYQQLAAAFRESIQDRRLTGGVRLPPERVLAAHLSVSRSTVGAAMDELADARLVDRRQGSGTYVHEQPRPPDEGRSELVNELDEHALLRDLSGGRQANIEFVAAAVDCAPEVRTAVGEIDQVTLERWTAGHGYVPLGIPPLREAAAAYLSDQGLPTAPEQVMVTTGAVEAVLLAARLFVEPGDPVAVETPSYTGGLDVLRSVSGRLFGVDTDHHGVRPDQLADLLSRSLPRLVYLIPDFHNPTGAVLNAARREQVARLAAEFHVPVVEDLVQRDLWFDEPPPLPIAAADPSAPVLTLGSMSKVFWGGLRIGWVRADTVTIERLGRIKTATNLGTPVIDQLVAARLLAQIDVVAKRRREQLAAGLDRLEQALTRHLPDWQWHRPAGGLSLWAQLPAPQAPALSRIAERHGVATVPGPSFGINGTDHRDRLRLPFVGDRDTIEAGIRRLAAAWHDITDNVDVGRQQRLVV